MCGTREPRSRGGALNGGGERRVKEGLRVEVASNKENPRVALGRGKE